MPTYFDGNLVFIHIPKCAGKSVRSALKEYQLRLLPQTHGAPLLYRWHESLSEVQALFEEKWDKEKFEQATIIAIIRHPIDRAISYWRYVKKTNMINFHTYEVAKKVKSVTKPNFKNTAVPYFTPEDYFTHNNKSVRCKHCIDYKYVEEFDALTFHNYIKNLTVWKKDGCSYPNCPYHALAPQVFWLRDIHGNIKIDKLNLFLMENLDSLERFMPEMGKLSAQLAYFEKKEDEDYREHLTTESLKFLNIFYADDLRLYEILKTSNAKLPEVENMEVIGA